MTKEQKIQVIEEYVGIFEKPGIYLMDFRGLNVAEMTELRSKLREAHVSIRVVKNTLAKRALTQVGIESLQKFFTGPVGVVWSEDSVSPARLLLLFIKEHEKGTIKAALLDGSLVTENEIEVISTLPSKQEIQAKLASTLNAPIVRLARALNAVPEKCARIIKALSDKRSVSN